MKRLMTIFALGMIMIFSVTACGSFGHHDDHRGPPPERGKDFRHSGKNQPPPSKGPAPGNHKPGKR